MAAIEGHPEARQSDVIVRGDLLRRGLDLGDLALTEDVPELPVERRDQVVARL